MNTNNTNKHEPTNPGKEKIGELLYHLKNPQVYTGREIHAVKKSYGPGTIRICLVFPDKYEIGMSHFGLTILYHQLNAIENVAAERCFLPAKPSIEIFKERDVPLFSLESKTPLMDFDLVSFSLLSEMTYTNVLQVLDLARIPLLSAERGPGIPLIAAGGISAVNPEPIRDFIDFFGIGDGEALFPDIVNALDRSHKERLDRQSMLQLMSRISGVYVPALHPPVNYGRYFGPDLPVGHIKKRIVQNMDDFVPQDRLIMPVGNVVFNRLNVEIARGCPQSCRFCQAKSYYAPYRGRSLDTNIANIHRGLRETGFDSFSLSTLSTGDYPQLKPLLQLIPRVITPAVSFSLSSLRPSTLSDHILSTIALYKRTGITIVPEAGTQRLRNAIGKDVTQDEIFQAVDLALKNRWQKIKLYFMIGLPTETMEDIDGIIQLVKDIFDMARAAKRKIKVHASFSSFVPKPQTPLQWARREPLADLQDKISYLKKNLKQYRALDLDTHLPHNGVVETILARGDYRVGQLLLDAFKKGEIFSAWDMEFNFPAWKELIENGPYHIFLDQFPVPDRLPWDFLSVNFSHDHLIGEYQNAIKGKPSTSCNDMTCKECGGCLYTMKRDTAAESPDIEKILAEMKEKEMEEIEIKEKDAGNDAEEIVYNKIRLWYRKTGDYVFFSQLAMLKHIERMIRKAALPFKYSRGFTPRMKISSLPPLPVYASGWEEVVELFIESHLTETEILETLNRSSKPQGFVFEKAVICNQSPNLTRDISFVGFEILMDEGECRRHLEGLLDSISKHLGDRDAAHFSNGRLVLNIDYSNQGQERFAKIYKLIDPDKQYTRCLTRTHVTFKSLATAKKEEVEEKPVEKNGN